MLWRLVSKLLFKASIPLILMAGFLSYGVYMRGGDTGEIWTGAAQHGLERITGLFATVRGDAIQAVTSVSRTASSIGEREDPATGALTRFYTWRDSAGVTHYSSSIPEGGEAAIVSINPDVNIVAPVTFPASAIPPGQLPGMLSPASPGGAISEPRNRAETNRSHRTASESNQAAARQEVADQLGGSLPGMAGQVLSLQPEGDMPALDASQLIRMLQ